MYKEQKKTLHKISFSESWILEALAFAVSYNVCWLFEIYKLNLSLGEIIDHIYRTEKQPFFNEIIIMQRRMKLMAA